MDRFKKYDEVKSKESVDQLVWGRLRKQEESMVIPRFLLVTSTSSREVVQTLIFASNKRGAEQEVWAVLLRGRTRSECPEGNLRELT